MVSPAMWCRSLDWSWLVVENCPILQCSDGKSPRSRRAVSTSNMDLMATVERHFQVPGYRATADGTLRKIDYWKRLATKLDLCARHRAGFDDTCCVFSKTPTNRPFKIDFGMNRAASRLLLYSGRRIALSVTSGKLCPTASNCTSNDLRPGKLRQDFLIRFKKLGLEVRQLLLVSSISMNILGSDVRTAHGGTVELVLGRPYSL